MRLTRRRYRRPGSVRRTLGFLFQKDHLKFWLIALLIVAVIITTVILLTAPKPVTLEDTSLYGKNEITIGIAVDECPSFASMAEDGSISGFEKDLMDTLVSSLYPDAEIIYRAMDAELISYELRAGNIDLAIGMLPKDALRSQGLSLSSAYYTDGVYAFTVSGRYASLGSLLGTQASVMITEVSKSTVSAALKEENLSIDLISCSSYPDGILGVQNGNNAALIAPKCKTEAKQSELIALPEKICDVSYHIAAWTENANVIKLINKELTTLSKNGTYDELLQKWDIPLEAKEADA